MYLVGKKWAKINPPSIWKVSENPEPFVKNNTLYVTMTDGESKLGVRASDLTGERDAARRIVEHSLYHTSSYWEKSGFSKTELRKMFREIVLGEYPK